MSKGSDSDTQVDEKTELNTDSQEFDNQDSTEGSGSGLNTGLTPGVSGSIKFDKFSDAFESGKSLRCSLTSKGFDGIEKEIAVYYFSGDGKIRKEGYGTFSNVSVYTSDKVYYQADTSDKEVTTFTGSEAKTYWDKLMGQSISNYDCVETQVSTSIFAL